MNPSIRNSSIFLCGHKPIHGSAQAHRLRIFFEVPHAQDKLRKEAAAMGLDPNIWFRNVEVVAAKRIGRETVNYVSNIFKYYIAYRLIVDKEELKEKIEKQ